MKESRHIEDDLIHQSSGAKPHNRTARRFGIRDGDAETLEEIGQTWAVTRERVRQVEAKALEHLRAPATRRMLEHFTNLDKAAAVGPHRNSAAKASTHPYRAAIGVHVEPG